MLPNPVLRYLANRRDLIFKKEIPGDTISQ